jgi:hypothetical protein
MPSSPDWQAPEMTPGGSAPGRVGFVDLYSGPATLDCSRLHDMQARITHRQHRQDDQPDLPAGEPQDTGESQKQDTRDRDSGNVPSLGPGRSG